MQLADLNRKHLHLNHSLLEFGTLFSICSPILALFFLKVSNLLNKNNICTNGNLILKLFKGFVAVLSCTKVSTDTIQPRMTYIDLTAVDSLQFSDSKLDTVALESISPE